MPGADVREAVRFTGNTVEELSTTIAEHTIDKHTGILVATGNTAVKTMALLEQTKDAGVNVYTHSEMLPANYYPAFKKYDHLVGNYGGSWYKRGSEFASFIGPILMTTNCITAVRPACRYNNLDLGDISGIPRVLDAGQCNDSYSIPAITG